MIFKYLNKSLRFLQSEKKYISDNLKKKTVIYWKDTEQLTEILGKPEGSELLVGMNGAFQGSLP